MSNLADSIWRHADVNPDNMAVRQGDRLWTYGELRASVIHAADELRERGVGRGDRVLLMLPTSAEFVVLYHGVLSIGATAVTVNTLNTARELEYFLTDAGCSLAIGWDDNEQALHVAAERAGVLAWIVGEGALDGGGKASSGADSAVTEMGADEAAVLIYTSGTTGQPKGAVLTHGNLEYCAETFSDLLGLSLGDRMGTALPLFHVFGQGPVMAAVLHSGGCLSLLRSFNATDMLDVAASHRLTHMAGVPAMWIAMVHAETGLTIDDFETLRMVCSGGAAMPLEVSKAFRDRFGVSMSEGYGLTETTGAVTFTGMADETPKEGSVGRAVPGCRIAIVDARHQPVSPGEVGEVAVSGPLVMREYWGRPDATRAAHSGEWFLTGDLGRMDEAGDLWIVDRIKDMIVRGGYNVYPREVEEALYRHPAVLEAAVVGVPDERLGEEVAAVLSLRPGQQVDSIDLRAWLSESLAAYKVPRIYSVVTEIPKGSTGKILKRSIDLEQVANHGSRPK